MVSSTSILTGVNPVGIRSRPQSFTNFLLLLVQDTQHFLASPFALFLFHFQRYKFDFQENSVDFLTIDLYDPILLTGDGPCPASR
jgi:hypothetical protein